MKFSTMVASMLAGFRIVGKDARGNECFAWFDETKTPPFRFSYRRDGDGQMLGPNWAEKWNDTEEMK